MAKVLSFNLATTLFDESSDQVNHEVRAGVETLLGLANLYIDPTVAFLAEVAPIPRLGLFIVELLREAIVELVLERTFAPELFLFDQYDIMFTDAVHFSRKHHSHRNVLPQVLLFALQEPLLLLLTA